MVNGVDTNFPLDPLVWFKERFFVWNPAQNSGVDASASVTGLFFHGLQALLYLLGFSLINTEKLTFVFWFLMLGFSIYYLISVLQKVYFQSLNNWWAIYLPRLTAVCFYIFNLYQFDVWKNVKVANLMLLVAIPLILGSFMEGLYKKTKIPTMIFKIALFSLLFSGFGLNPSYFLVLILVIALYGISSLFDKNLAQRTTFSKITFTLLSIVLIFAISAFWIMPLAANILRDHGLSGLSIKDLGLQDWLYGLSKNTSTIAVLRFLGAWDWYEKGLFNIPYVSFAKAYFTNPFLILFSVLIPGVAFGGFFLGRKYFFPFYFIVLVFLGVILGTGVHAPFGFFYLWLSQNVSLVSLFRSPWYIFTPLTVLGFAVLIALFTQEVLVRLKFSLVAKSTIILFILSNFIFNYPFLRGDIFRPNQQLGTFFVKIPNYVYAFDNFLKTVPEDARILNLPLESAENYTWGYSGVTPLVSLFSNKSIIFPTYGQENQGLVSDMGNILEEEIALGNIASVRKIFSFLNIGYVLNKKDLFDASVFNDNLFEDSVFDLNNKKTFGEWSFFPLTNAYTGSLFWTAKDKVMVSGNPAKLVTVSSLTEYQKDSEVYFPDMISSSLESKSFKTNKIFAVADCIRCQGEKPKDPFLPYVRFLPGSLLYNLISFKEQRQEGTFVDPVVKSDFELSLSLKRLAEIKGLLDKADPNAGDQIVDTFDALQEKIRQSITLLDKADEQQGDTNGERIKILDYLAGYQNYLRVFSDKYLPSGVADKIDETSLFIEKEKLAMENKLWVTDNILEKKYIIGIPRSGEYKMLMQEDKNALVSF